MKRIIMLFFAGSIFTATVSMAHAQGAGAAYTASNLTPELNAIIENAKKECNLNPDQSAKFKNDYILFLNENAKPNANTQGLFFLLGIKFRGYMNEAQFTKITQMIKDGKLNPPGNKTNLATQTAKTTGALTPATSPTPLPASVTSQSNVTTIFEQLRTFMKITPEKAAQVIPILKDYDQQLGKIKKENAGNAAKIKQLTDALNGQAVPKLKMYMSDEQLTTLVVALGMQENILSGKNLSVDQKIFLDKVRGQYGLNDVQTMSVILVLVQGKIRGDAIGLLSKVNPQQAGQEFIILMQDLDGQLKSSLTNDQYIKVKSDIEKLIKGQKL
ncbi:MAG: hypothetical protein IT271_05450 [Chitinophagales bacterium]|nr:hypothetical protein [Chitinophagales bacterium]